jgi:hypothetical protein
LNAACEILINFVHGDDDDDDDDDDDGECLFMLI